MAFDFLDQQKVQEARIKAIQAGYDPEDVDSFIQSKQGVQKSASAIQTGALGIKDLPQEQRVDVANYLGQIGFDFSQAPEEKKDPFAAQKRSALQAVTQLEELYGRGDAKNVGTKQDLSLAGKGRRGSKFIAKVRPKSDQTREDLTIYNSQLALALATLTQAFGSGAPQEGEAQRLIESAPNAQSTDREAKEWFKSVKSLLSEPTANTKTDTQNTQQTTTQSPTQTAAQTPQAVNSVQQLLDPQAAQTQTQPLNTSLDLSKILASNPPGARIVNNQGQPGMPAQVLPQQQLAQNDGNSLMDTILGKPLEAAQPKEDLTGLQRAGLAVSNAAVPVGATIGGLAGGILGTPIPVAGNAAGAVVGAGLGAAGGVVIRDNIRGLLNIENRDPIEVLQDYGTDVARETAWEVVGGGLGRVGSFVAKPMGKLGTLVIKEVGESIDDIPIKSIRAAPSAVTDFSKKHGIDLGQYMIERGYVGNQIFEDVTSDYQRFGAKYGSYVDRPEVRVPTKDLANAFSKKIKELGQSNIADSASRNKAIKILDEWEIVSERLNKRGVDNVGMDELWKMKQNYQSLVSNKDYVNDNVKNIYLELERMYNEVLQEVFDKNLPEGASKGELKALGLEMSKQRDLMRLAKIGKDKGRGALFMNLIKTNLFGAGAGAGAVLLGIPGAIGGATMAVGLDAAARNPEVLYKMLKMKEAALPGLRAAESAFNTGANALPAVGGAISHPLGNLLFPSQLSQEDQQRLEEEQARNGY